jgi:pimeloyl-ACP methyl ester carboxylesterase
MNIPFTYRHVPGSDWPVTLFPGLVGKDWIWTDTVGDLTDVGHGTLVWNAAVAELDVGEPTTFIVELSDSMYALLDRLSIERTVVCGNSLGALLALEFAAAHPDRTAGLILSGCPGLGEKIVDVDFFFRHEEREILEEFRRRMFYREPESVPAGVIEEAMEMVLDRPMMLKLLRVLRSADLHDTEGQIANVECPTCVIWGEHDLITPIENWRPHFPRFPDADLHVVPECGHSPMIEKPEVWASLLSEFLGRVTSGVQQG